MRTLSLDLRLTLSLALFCFLPFARATSVTLTAPTNNEAIDGPTNITLVATTSGGTITQVQFYEGTNSVGVATNTPYMVIWTNTSSGPFTLSAVATDSSSINYTSAVFSIIVAPAADAVRLWLRQDDLSGLTNNAPVAAWPDITSFSNSASQSSGANRPTFVTNAANGLPAVSFDGAHGYLTLPNFLHSLTQAEAFVVLKSTASEPGSVHALWSAGGSGTAGSLYPYSDSSIYDDFGSTVRRSLGIPGATLNSPHLFDAVTSSNEWSFRINGILYFTSAANTVSFTTSPILGENSGYYFAGDIAEVMVYARELSPSEREGVAVYLNGKYGFTTNAPDVPANLTALPISTNQISLTWGAALTNIQTTFTVQRKTGSGGTYAPVALVDNGLSYLDSGLAPGTQYYYEVSAGNAAGTSGLSNETNATTMLAGPAIPSGSLVLWLKGDGGHGEGSISGWADASGSSNHAWQSSSADFPSDIDAAVNGMPAISFDGAHDYFDLPNFLSGLSSAEAFVVLKSTAVEPGSIHALWTFGGSGSTGELYPYSDGGIYEDFGSTARADLGIPSQPLGSYHLYDVSSASGAWSARINGVALYGGAANTVSFPTTPLLGQNSGYYFEGSVAEVMVFNRQMAVGERSAVGAYLNQKYALETSPPGAPTNFTSVAISSNQVSLTWTFAITNTGSTFLIQRKTGLSGTYGSLAAVENTGSFIDNTVQPGFTYYYQVQAQNFAGVSGLSTEESAAPLSGAAALPTGNLTLWLKADAGHDGGALASWADQSGNGRDATQTSDANQPTAVNGVVNGLPAVHFDGLHDYFNLPNFMSGATQAEALVVLRVTSTNPTTGCALWTMGTSGSYGDIYPGSDGSIRDDFGSATARLMGRPGAPLNQFQIYDVAAQSGQWTAWVNAAEIYTASANTVGFTTTPYLGVNTGEYFAGDIAEVMVFNRPLTTDESLAAGTYLNQKYLIDASPPPAPGSLTATAVSSNQISLTWTSVITNSGAIYTVQRADGGSGTFASVAQVENTGSFIDSGVTPGVQYYYQVTAQNYAGSSPPSNEAAATPLLGSSAMPVTNLLLWLKADAGHGVGTLGCWADQSGRGNHAYQTTTSAEPVTTNSALNGMPAVHFDGLHDYFNMPNLMTGATQAEVFVVLRASSTNTSGHALWTLGGAGSYGDIYPNSDGSIHDDFGSTAGHIDSSPSQPLNQYHLFNVDAAAGEWTCRLNGNVNLTTTNNTVAFASTVYLAENTAYYFGGEIAEVMVFNQVLGLAQRQAVGAYLNGKYAFMTGVPATPTNLTAVVLSTNQVSVAWSVSFTSSDTTYMLQRKTGLYGAYATIATLDNTGSYLDTNVVAGAEYSYQVLAQNYAGTSAASNQATVTPEETGATLPVNAVALWLKADAGHGAGSLSLWTDQSGNLNNASQSTSANQPLIVNNQANGMPVVHFDGSSSYLNLPNFMNGFTQAEAMVVLRVSATNPISPHALWQFGASGQNGSFYPATNGAVSEEFATTTTRSNASPALDLSQFHLYDVAGSSSDWSMRLNGQAGLTASLNSVAFSSSPVFGSNHSRFFAGDVAEILLFNRELTGGERFGAACYLNQKYGFGVPAAPSVTNLTATALSSTQVSLSWTVSPTNSGASYVITRQSWLGGTFDPIAVVDNVASFTDATASPASYYCYIVVAENYAATSGSSNESCVRTPAATGSTPVDFYLGVLPAGAGTNTLGNQVYTPLK